MLFWCKKTFELWKCQLKKYNVLLSQKFNGEASASIVFSDCSTACVSPLIFRLGFIILMMVLGDRWSFWSGVDYWQYQILRRCRYLIPHIFQNFWNQMENFGTFGQDYIGYKISKINWRRPCSLRNKLILTGLLNRLAI